MKRKSLAHAPCPVARALEAVGDWWSLLIVRDALMGKRRFGEFQQSLGAARNILAARLKNSSPAASSCRSRRRTAPGANMC
jgi:DNA-binding HxlR family transcriptional regulator